LHLSLPIDQHLGRKSIKWNQMESVKIIKSSQELIDYLIVCVTSNLKNVRVSVGVVSDFDFLSLCAILHC
jgi:hypothetical protein